jgi:hypothetical protein
LFAEARGYLNQQFEVSIQDFLFGDAKAGATFFFDQFQVTPYGRITGLNIDDNHRLTEAGGGVAIAANLTPSFTVRAGFEALKHSYSRHAKSPLTKQRNGELFSGSAGLSFCLDRDNTVSVDLAYHRKNARVNWYSYKQFDARLANFTLLGQGQYLLAEAKVWRYRADAPNPFYSLTIRRKDFRFKARLAYGVPVATLAKWLGGSAEGPIGDINVQVSGAYFHQNSNIPIFDVSNFTGDVIFTKRFKF